MSKNGNGNGSRSPMTIFATIVGTAIVSAITAWGATNAGDAVAISTEAKTLAVDAQDQIDINRGRISDLYEKSLKLQGSLKEANKKIGLLNRNIDELQEQLRLELTGP